jgi:predicted peptidase
MLTSQPSRWLRTLVAVALAFVALQVTGCARKRTARRPMPPIALPAPPAEPTEGSTGDEIATPLPDAELTTLAPPSGCRPSSEAPWLQCQFINPRGDRLHYFLFLPSPRSDEAAYPLVTFLHGSSGSGPGDGKPISGGHRFGSGLWIRDDIQQRYPSIVVAPQADPAPGETWVRAWRPPPPGDQRPTEALVLANQIIDQLAAELPVDMRRLYLTGQSMGGFGAWLAYTRFPGRFAAIVPVCGGGDPGAVVPNPTAVWAFHGDSDSVVPVRRSREMVAAIEAVGGDIRYTEYPGMGHNIFARSYAESDLAAWLFAQQVPSD